jgi:DNA-directed RNA polymerase specialized sigma subunit
MNAVRKLAKKNAERRQMEAGKTFMQMLEAGKSAKEIGAVFGITEQQASRLILKAKLQIGKADDCSASTEVTVNYV